MTKTIPNDLIQAHYHALVLDKDAHDGDEEAIDQVLKILGLEPPFTAEDLGMDTSHMGACRTDPVALRDQMIQVFHQSIKRNS